MLDYRLPNLLINHVVSALPAACQHAPMIVPVESAAVMPR